MKLSLQHHNKKGLSEIVSYVLLIVIAVSISFLVFNYLKVLVPKESASCPDDVSLIASEFSCISSSPLGTINLVLTNKGFWRVDGYYIRADEKGVQVKKYWLNDPSLNSPPASYLFNIGGRAGLNPGESYNYSFNSKLFNDTSKTYEIEIEPFINDGKKRVFCEKAISSQVITCLNSAT